MTHQAKSPAQSTDRPRDVTRPRLVFIAGTNRCGSTLLERMLGQVPGSCSVGELVHLWERGVLEDQRCGCGETFRSCPFWVHVGEEAFGGWSELGSVYDLKRRVDRHRYVPLMLAPQLSAAYAADLARFSDMLVRLYRSIAKASGSTVIIDSSKSSSYLLLLRRIPVIDLRLVHLVRDSRGVAYSATKRVKRPEIVRDDSYMPTYHPAQSAIEWDFYNSMFELMRASGIPGLRLRYEDLVADPRHQLSRVFHLGGLVVDDSALTFLQDGTASLGTTHTISGNPMRFRTGAVPLSLDLEWRDRLRPRQRRMVTLLTWPLLKRYGYDTRS